MCAAVQSLPAHEAHHPGEHPRGAAPRPIRGHGGALDRRPGPGIGPANDRPAASGGAGALRPRQSAPPRGRGADLKAMAERIEFDGVLVLGAGLAGLTTALAAAPRRVLVLSPTSLGEGCASSWAQGG